ncbi:hypothetical protein [Vampirovibrio chlorellavorus]|uniref:hypothetical protein n=1 Tax=Vampirovibrio chlorellavorus TaxID=758823 RepID=UPI0026F0722E|nr:hypothetical protein [Vampirovibrio chlorellavorus]
MTSQKSLSDIEKHRRSQLYARLTYVGIILVFVSLCAVAVLVTMSNEAKREGFRPIEVSKPISFFDYSYVKKDKKP